MPKLNGQPGTVSKILWHFTGGPKWNSSTDRQETRRKPAPDAYKAFTSILRAKELRVGGYAELARVIIKERHRYDRSTGQKIIEKDVPVVVRSAPVCCLADIPIAHLRYHENRYGRFAIGFHRDAAVRHSFNPVLYTLEHTNLIRSIYDGLAELESIDCASPAFAAMDISNYSGDCEHDDIEDLKSSAFQIEGYMDDIDESVKASRKRFAKIVAFVKTFTEKEFTSIYCEREWRSLDAFKFTRDDLAMLILPHRIGKVTYYGDFIRDQIRRLKLPRRIPVVPWEDLIEH